jgi:hypothetical protein
MYALSHVFPDMQEGGDNEASLSVMTHPSEVKVMYQSCLLCVRVCVCVCVREREREREFACVCLSVCLCLCMCHDAPI